MRGQDKDGGLRRLQSRTGQTAEPPGQPAPSQLWSQRDPGRGPRSPWEGREPEPTADEREGQKGRRLRVCKAFISIDSGQPRRLSWPGMVKTGKGKHQPC